MLAGVPHAISLERISHGYGAGSVLCDLDLQVRAGELLAILGESGCGKSTLLRLITGLEQPSSGTIRLFDREQSSIPPHQRPLAWVTQTAGCYDHLTVDENLRLARQLAKSSGSISLEDAVHRQHALIEDFGLSGLLSRNTSTLSGGERQRLAIARALLTLRPILLLDEPLAHLNESLRESLRRKIRQWTKQLGITTLFVTHDSVEAMEIADRIAILHAGRIEQIDAPKLIYESPRTVQIASAFGKPCIQIFETSKDLTKGTVGRIGVRPWDWERLVGAGTESRSVRLGDGHSAPEVIGTLIEVRCVESHWWCDLDVGLEEPMRVVVPRWDPSHTTSVAMPECGTQWHLRARRWHRW